MFNQKNRIMCCIENGIWQDTEIRFMRKNIFCEQGQYVVNHPKNADDFNDKIIPDKIALSAIKMEPGIKEEILSRIQRERHKKIAAKAKRQKKV